MGGAHPVYHACRAVARGAPVVTTIGNRTTTALPEPQTKGAHDLMSAAADPEVPAYQVLTAKRGGYDLISATAGPETSAPTIET